jgi:hypothetical protein
MLQHQDQDILWKGLHGVGTAMVTTAHAALKVVVESGGTENKAT